MTEYQKIPGPFKRATEGTNRNKIIPWAWSSPELEALADSQWHWTEKIDGTNIRVIWNGHQVTYGGRTDAAQIPAKLVQYLILTFTEELMEQTFGGSDAVLYGEGCGSGIQKNGVMYGPEPTFVLFDVRVERWWLNDASVYDVADKLGIKMAESYGTETLRKMIQNVARSPIDSLHAPGCDAEGMVGRTVTGLLGRNGERIIVKLKGRDLLGVNLG